MFDTIVWATDGSADSDHALPYAKSLADAPGKRLIAIHVRELLAGRAGGYPVHADEDELVAKVRGQVETARAEGIDVTLEVAGCIGSHAARLVADAAAKAGADVIVVGTRGHAPLAGFLLGSVTQRLLHEAHCPVLAVSAQSPEAAVGPERETVALG